MCFLLLPISTIFAWVAVAVGFANNSKKQVRNKSGGAAIAGVGTYYLWGLFKKDIVVQIPSYVTKVLDQMIK